MDPIDRIIDTLVDAILDPERGGYECPDCHDSGAVDLAEDVLRILRPHHVVLGGYSRATCQTREQYEAQERGKAWFRLRAAEALGLRVNAPTPLDAYLAQCDALHLPHPEGCDCPKHD